MKRVLSYIHCPTMQGHQLILEEMLQRRSGWSFDVCSTELCVPTVGCEPLTCLFGFTGELHVAVEGQLRDYEMLTLARLYAAALTDPDPLYCYQHLKGLGALAAINKDEKASDRRQLCDEFDKLDLAWFDDPNVQAIGANAVVTLIGGGRSPHFSGNWWMARGSWIARLFVPTLESARANFPWHVPPDRLSRGVGHHPDTAYRYFWEGWIGQPKDPLTGAMFISPSSKIVVTP